MIYVDLLLDQSPGIVDYMGFALCVTNDVVDWFEENGIPRQWEAIYEQKAYGRKDCIGYRFSFMDPKEAILFKLAWG